MIIPRNEVIEGNVLDVLRTLPENSVDVVVTSPPYWGLRDYGSENIVVWGGKLDCQHQWAKLHSHKYSGGTNSELMQTHPRVKETHFNVMDYGCELCGAWKGQLGLEPHPQMFIDHLNLIFLEVMRVLKPTGSCWIVIGDTYYGGGGGHQYSPENQGLTAKAFRANADKEEACGMDYGFRKKFKSNWLQTKQLMLIPERLAFEMQESGWILRNKGIWNKINPMPSSARDRLTNSYEDIFFFVKKPDYYFDLEAIRKQYKVVSKSATMNMNANTIMGGNPGDVWSFTSEAFKGQHFATFPQKLVKRILKAAAPKATCVECGKPRERIIARNNLSGTNPSKDRTAETPWIMNGTGASTLHTELKIERSTLGFTDCGCGKNFQSGLVLDPFCGSGTTLLVAHKMGLDWLGIDINTKYCKMANKRLESHGKVRLDKYMERGQLK